MKHTFKLIAIMIVLSMILMPVAYAATASSHSSSSASRDSGAQSSSSSTASGGENSDSSSSEASGDSASSSSSATASDGGTAIANSKADSTNGGSATANSDVIASGDGVVVDCDAVAISDGSDIRKDCKDIKTVVLKEGKETSTYTAQGDVALKTVIKETTKEESEPKESNGIGNIIDKVLRFLHLI